MGHFRLQSINQLILLNLQIRYPKLQLIRILTLLFIIPSFNQYYLILQLWDLVLEPLVLSTQLLGALLGVVFGCWG